MCNDSMAANIEKLDILAKQQVCVCGHWYACCVSDVPNF